MNQRTFVLESEQEIKKHEPRLAEIVDIKSIQRLVSIFGFLYTESIKQMISKGNRVYCIGDKGDVGSVLIFNASHTSIQYLVTDFSHRKYGLGKKVFDFGIKYADINALIIKATTYPESSLGFWQSLGFTSTEKVYVTKKGSTLTEMIWYRIDRKKVNLYG